MCGQVDDKSQCRVERYKKWTEGAWSLMLNEFYNSNMVVS